MPRQRVPSTRAERIAFVERQRREIEADEILNPPRPTTQAQRRRAVEVLRIAAGDFTPAPWERRRAEPIDTSPWEASRQASLRAQHQRFGRYGFALATDGTIRCTKCKDVVLAIPRDRPFAMGTPVSALAARHAETTGCR